MLSQIAQKIINEIDAYMTASGVQNSKWYVGIASDAEARLFVDHKVNRDTDQWIYRTATTASEARDIEAIYHKAGCQGGSGGGDYTSKIVYAYVITNHSVE